MIARSDARSFAAELRRAERMNNPAPLPSERFAELSWTDARAIALERDRLRIADDDTPVGYKLGWTSAAMREALGIDRPNWGTLWASQRLDGLLGLRDLRHPKAEPEIVFVGGADLVGDAITSADVIASAAGWAIGVEVVHPRYESYDFAWLDNTADNSSAGAIAVGPTRRLVDDPGTLTVDFTDGTEQRSGRGDRAMGSPAEAVAWLVRSLAVESRSLTAGQIVFTGGLTAPFDIEGGRTYSASAPTLGSVSFDTR